jgi:hypothetical protein
MTLHIDEATEKAYNKERMDKFRADLLEIQKKHKLQLVAVLTTSPHGIYPSFSAVPIEEKKEEITNEKVEENK